MNRSILVLVASVLIAVAGQTVLKMGMTDVGRIGSAEARDLGATFMRVAANPKVVGGLALYFVSALLYMVALSRVDLSAAYPFAGLSYVAIALIAWLVLGEQVPVMRWVGTLVITLGVGIVAFTL